LKKIGAFIVFILSFSFLFSITNYTKSFFGVYGKRASLMGKIDGSAFEVWVYPYKVFHNYEFFVIENGNRVKPVSNLSEFNISEYSVERKYTGESWKIDELIFVAYENPVAFMVYKIRNIKPIEIEVRFKPDLSPMWPASLGGKFSWWNDKGYFVLGEARWKSFAFIGFPKGIKEGKLPAHKLPGGKLKYRVRLNKGEHEIVVPISAGYGDYKKLEESFLRLKNDWVKSFEKRIKILNKFKSGHLNIKSSDKELEFSMNRAVLNINSAFVNNPYLGEGLIAGYGLSGEGERPGFAWYFGGDGVINSLAILDYGDFEVVKKEIEFLFKYQRKDGKIPHEISQGARFVNWFKDYGFPYFHGDTTLYFTVLLGEYLKYTGDKSLLKKYEDKIKLLMDWIISCDKDKDGIVETKYAGTGASETGPLRKFRIKTDILLAGLSVKAWDELKVIWEELYQKKRYYQAKEFYLKSKKTFEEMFYNSEKKYYDYAAKEGERVNVKTVWPAIAMRFSVAGKENGRNEASLISSPYISSDWGVRFLSSGSKYYEPLSYNNGAVWPFLTGFASLALYKYRNPYHAYSLLRDNLGIIKDFDYGYATELLSGDMYIPLDQSVNNQIWSYGTTVSAFVEGMLGFYPDVLKRKIKIHPKIPLDIKNLDVKNLKAGKGKLDLSYKFENNRIIFFLKAENLRGYEAEFVPEINANNVSVKSDCFSGFEKKKIRINDKSFSCKIEYEISSYAYPLIEYGNTPGQISKHPIISSFDFNSKGFKLKVWGKNSRKIKIITDKKFTCENFPVSENTININFGKNWEQKEIVCGFEKDK